jgi:hypothetical protein
LFAVNFSKLFFGSVIAALVVSATSSEAGLIPPGTYSATGNGNGNGSATVTDIGPPVNLELITVSKAFTAIGPIDLAFAGVHSNNVVSQSVNYLVTEGVTNTTNQAWIGYHVTLGQGVDNAFVEGSPVTFAPVDATFTHPFFATQVVTSSEINYSGGSIAPGTAISFSFTISVPDPLLVDGQLPPYSFTLRQDPVAPRIPEPSSLVLLSLGLVGLFLAARRRRTG